MKIERTLTGLLAVAAALVWIPASAAAQEAGHGAMQGIHHGHGEGAAKEAPGDAAARRVDVWVCAGDESTGLRWEAPCPLDGKPAVKKTVERSTFTDLNNPKCPIMGGDTDGTVFALYKGKAVRFCCPGCADGFFKDPAGHIAKLEKEAAGAKGGHHDGGHGGHH